MQLADVRTMPRSRRHPHFAARRCRSRYLALVSRTGIFRARRPPQAASRFGEHRDGATKAFAATPITWRRLRSDARWTTLVAAGPARRCHGNDVRGGRLVAVSSPAHRRRARGARHRGEAHHVDHVGPAHTLTPFARLTETQGRCAIRRRLIELCSAQRRARASASSRFGGDQDDRTVAAFRCRRG